MPRAPRPSLEQEPDIISDRTPFGHYKPPPSPAVGARLPPPSPSGGGLVPPSPARTLSGRPSPFLAPALSPTAPPPFLLGGGPGMGHGLLSTPSEAQAFDDFSGGQLEAAGRGRACRCMRA